MSRLLQIILIIIIGFCVYANSLNNKFLWDDEFLVKENIYIKNPGQFAHIFSETIGMGAGVEGNYYRPLQMLTYAFDYSVWRLNVFGYHITSVALHILAALSIYWLINLLYNRRTLSFLTSILFVVHPIHTDAVDYISGRADLLTGLFILLCLICYVKQSLQRNPVAFALMLFCAIAAMLSMEYGLIIPALIVLYSYIFKRKILIKEFGATLAITLAYIALRGLVVNSPPLTAAYIRTMPQRIPGFYVSLAEYARLLLLPFNLHKEYGNKLFSFNEFQAMIGVVIMLSLVVLAFQKTKAGNIISFSISWFFITLLPVSNLYPINAYMAEHRLYLPSIGIFLLLAYGLLALRRRLKRLKSAVICLIAFMITAYAYLTVRQNVLWKEPIDFYNRTLGFAPDSCRLYHNLGKEYMRAGNYQEAVRAFRKEIEMDPKNESAYSMLGVAYGACGDIKRSVSSFQTAISINPEYALAYYNLGNEYVAVGDTQKAIASYRRAIQLDPKSATSVLYYNNLAGVYITLGDTKAATALYEQALSIDPENPTLYHNIKTLYEKSNL